MDEAKKITLISADNRKFEVSENIIKKSLLIKHMLNDYPDNYQIPLKNVKGKILEKIIEYLKHYENNEPMEIPKPLPDDDFKKYVNEWDYKYIDLDLETTCEIIICANHMDIKSLLELASAKMAFIIKQNDKNKIRKDFKISNDLNPTEEEEMIKEETWSLELI